MQEDRNTARNNTYFVFLMQLEDWILLPAMMKKLYSPLDLSSAVDLYLSGKKMRVVR